MPPQLTLTMTITSKETNGTIKINPSNIHRVIFKSIRSSDVSSWDYWDYATKICFDNQVSIMGYAVTKK